MDGEFDPTGGNITAIDGNAAVTLSGSGVFTKINFLNTVDGVFTLAAGRNFSPAGALAVTGTLEVGASSALTLFGANA